MLLPASSIKDCLPTLLFFFFFFSFPLTPFLVPWQSSLRDRLPVNLVRTLFVKGVQLLLPSSLCWSTVYCSLDFCCVSISCLFERADTTFLAGVKTCFAACHAGSNPQSVYSGFVKIFFLFGPLVRHVTKCIALRLPVFQAAQWHLYSELFCSMNALFENKADVTM